MLKEGFMTTNAEAISESHARHLEPVAYQLLTVAVAVVALLVVLAGRPSVPASDIDALLVWTGLVALAGLVPISGRGPWLSLDLPLLLAAGFVFSPVVAAAMALVGCVDIRELRRDISVWRAIYNRSQSALCVAFGTGAFHVIVNDTDSWRLIAVAGLVAFMVDSLANYAFVAIGYSVAEGVSMRDSVARMRFGSLPTFVPLYFAFGFLSVLIAFGYEELGIVGVLAFTAPVLVARQAFLHRHLLEDAEASLRARRRALMKVDQRIADERRDERARIAEALHDDVLQCLYNVTIRAQVIREAYRTGRLLELEEDVPSLIDATQQAVDTLREVILDLRKSAVGHAGLVDTLALLAAHVHNETGAKVVTDLDFSIEMRPDSELLVYQIAREALSNAMKHASATSYRISLKNLEQSVRLRIEDDGRGFDVDAPRSDRHFGLELMRERAAAADGSLSLHSRPGRGTTVTATFMRR
jgi:signal transduction histidine kinase